MLKEFLTVGRIGFSVSSEPRFDGLLCRIVEVDELDSSRTYRVEFIGEGFFQGMRYWVNDVKVGD